MMHVCCGFVGVMSVGLGGMFGDGHLWHICCPSLLHRGSMPKHDWQHLSLHILQEKRLPKAGRCLHLHTHLQRGRFILMKDG